jgi:hypothetical protein
MDFAAPTPSASVALEMAWWLAGVWGLFGGLGIEASELYVALRRARRWPWKVEGEVGFPAFAVSVVIRGGLGFGLAVALAGTHQVSGPVGAIAVGVAAPFIFEQFKNARLPRADDVYKPMPETLLAKPPQPRKRSPAKKAQSGSRDGI